MDKDEALKLALDALDNLLYWDNGKSDYDQAREAITTIKQALAAPTSAEYAMGYAEGFNDGCKPAPVQEPVAWLYPEGLEALKAGKCWTAYGTKQDDNCNIPVHLNAAVAPKVEPVKTECDGFDSHPAAQPAPVQPMAHIVGEIDHTGKVWKPVQPAPVQERTDYAVHLNHCNIGECEGVCKYLDDDCPALKHADMKAKWDRPTPPAAQPAPVQPVPWSQALESVWAEPDDTPPAAQPVVPDAIHHTDMSESLEYIQGWNDCRAEMLKGMK